MAQTNEASRRVLRIARRACKEQGSFGVVPPDLVVVGVELKASLEHCEARQQGDAPCVRNGAKIPTKGGGTQSRICPIKVVKNCAEPGTLLAGQVVNRLVVDTGSGPIAKCHLLECKV